MEANDLTLRLIAAEKRIAERDRALAAIVAGWRETARVWELQIEERYQERIASGDQPPEKGRGALKNWCIWLRACADRVERALGSEHAE